jgi:hypothetical protein
MVRNYYKPVLKSIRRGFLSVEMWLLQVRGFRLEPETSNLQCAYASGFFPASPRILTGFTLMLNVM